MKASLRQSVGRPKVVSRIPEILRRCAGRKILHLGCADAPYTLERGDGLLHKLISEVTPAENLWGVDLDDKGVGFLREMGFDKILHGDCESLAEELLSERFDIILAGEIIEHVGNPVNFLNSIRDVMADNTELMLTTVNATGIKGFTHALTGVEKVHPDHNYYFSYHTLRQLLTKVDLDCREIYYYQDVVSGGLSGAVDLGFKLAAKVIPAWSDGVIVHAQAHH